MLEEILIAQQKTEVTMEVSGCYGKSEVAMEETA
jgi:hypothetical protein